MRLLSVSAFAPSLPVPSVSAHAGAHVARTSRGSLPSRRAGVARRRAAPAITVAGDATFAATSHAADGIATHHPEQQQQQQQQQAPLVKPSFDAEQDKTSTIVDPDVSVDPTAALSLDEISELIDAIDDSDVCDFRLVHKDIVIEISRPGGLGFDADGNLNAEPEPIMEPQSSAPLGFNNMQNPPQSAPFPGSDDSYPDVYQNEASNSNTSTFPASSDQSEDEEKDPDTVYESDFVVTSNRVGFFFVGAKNKPPLVKIGDSVEYNQPVCIIEQLGQQYVYLSEACGKVVKVFVEDGAAVQYGTEIMVIRPD